MTITAMDKKIVNFLESITLLDVEKHKILEKLRDLIFDNYPDMNERMQYGGILFSIQEDVAGLFAYSHHVSLEFGNGATFNDPNNILEGKGKISHSQAKDKAGKEYDQFNKTQKIVSDFDKQIKKLKK